MTLPGTVLTGVLKPPTAVATVFLYLNSILRAIFHRLHFYSMLHYVATIRNGAHGQF